MKYIAIDIGSSFIKFALLDLHSLTILKKQKTRSPNRLKNSNANYYEIPAKEIYEIVKEKIDDYTDNFTNISGVVLSTQMHGFIYKDSGTTEDIYVSWQDNRCLNTMGKSDTSYLEYLKEQISNESMIDNGVYLKPSLGMCNLYQLLSDKTEKEKNGELYTLGSYIISNLTGSNLCHITSAAPLGLVNVTKRTWDNNMIAKIGFKNIQFPKIIENDFDSCGVYFSNGQELKIFSDFGDQQVSILGSTTIDNDLVLNIATASQVSLITDTFNPGQYETRPYFEGKYINTISNLPSGRNLEVFVSFFSELLERISEQEVDINQIWKVILKDFDFNPENLQVNMNFYVTPDNANGGNIMGINSNNLRINTLLSAAFKDMAETYNEKLKILIKTQRENNQIICSGGVSWKIPQLLKVIKEITGYETVTPEFPDEVFAGLFRIALVCGGVCKDLDDTWKYQFILEGDDYY
ncbi:FGGY family carbohydrate kinase [Robertmurraya massiliosenegalensis]|uniref:sedoheptulokinase n=1 Tax=Robertmurraya TaxID=2837507 RepID=UPI0039A5F5A7